MAMDEHKICFITCVNQERYYQESLLYLQRLDLPPGFTAEYVPVRGAASMASGYNWGMRQSDAKYKLYLHQDVFVIHRAIMREFIELFSADRQIGCSGLAGAEQLGSDAIWWLAKKKYGSVYNVDEPESIRTAFYGGIKNHSVAVQAVDGLLMATQYDLPWREDLFTGWHFYDISQSMEFQRQGYRVVIPRQDKPWCVHYCGDKDMDVAYRKYRDIFRREYC